MKPEKQILIYYLQLIRVKISSNVVSKDIFCNCIRLVVTLLFKKVEVKKDLRKEKLGPKNRSDS